MEISLPSDGEKEALGSLGFLSGALERGVQGWLHSWDLQGLWWGPWRHTPRSCTQTPSVCGCMQGVPAHCPYSLGNWCNACPLVSLFYVCVYKPAWTLACPRARGRLCVSQAARASPGRGRGEVSAPSPLPQPRPRPLSRPGPAPFLPPSLPPAAAAAPRHKKRLGLGRAGTMTETTKTHVILLSCGTFNPITKGHIQMFGESRRNSGRGSGRGWGLPRGSRGAPGGVSGGAHPTGAAPGPPGRALSALGGAEGAAGGGGGTAGPGRLRGRSGRALSAAGGSGRAAAPQGGGLRAGPDGRCPRRMVMKSPREEAVARCWPRNQPGGHRGKRPHDGERRRGGWFLCHGRKAEIQAWVVFAFHVSCESSLLSFPLKCSCPHKTPGFGSGKGSWLCL